MIKVLLVVCNNVLNGTERYVLDVAGNLSPDEFDVTIATPLTGPLSELISEKKLKEFNYDNGKIEFYSLKGLFNLYKYIRKEKFNVVHANAKFHPCISAKLARVNLTVETKHGIFYTSRQLKKLSKFRIAYENIKQLFVDKFIAISENDKEAMVKYFRIREEKISVIYNGINIAEIKQNAGFDKFQKEISPDIIIGNIGRLTFQKAQEILLQAFNLLQAKIKNVKLILVGNGENENGLREYVKVNNLNDKVVFKGYIKDIYKELLNFDILAISSRYEGTPYVIFEAMALDIPVVTTDVGGISNILNDRYDAMICPYDSPGSLVKSLENIINDENLRKNIINSAGKTIKNYTIAKMASNVSDLYKSDTK